MEDRARFFTFSSPPPPPPTPPRALSPPVTHTDCSMPLRSSTFNEYQLRTKSSLEVEEWALSRRNLWHTCPNWRGGQCLFLYGVILFAASPWCNRHGWVGVKNQVSNFWLVLRHSNTAVAWQESRICGRTPEGDGEACSSLDEFLVGLYSGVVVAVAYSFSFSANAQGFAQSRVRICVQCFLFVIMYAFAMSAVIQTAAARWP